MSSLTKPERALVRVERTEMGQLVENREELTATVKALTENLRNLSPWSEKFVLASRRQRLADMQRNIATKKTELARLVAEDQERQELVALIQYAPLRRLVDEWNGTARGFVSLPDQIAAAREQLQDMEADFDEQVAEYEADPPVDPHIEIAEALATAESALAATRAQIDVLRREAHKHE